MKQKIFCLIALWGMIFSWTPLGMALGEIVIDQVRAQELEPNRFLLQGLVKNSTLEPREVTLRAQVTVYDRMVPKGDVPLSVVRKDLTFVLRPGETRKVDELFVGEGSPPKGAYRSEPSLRVRRQRVWSY